MLNKLFHQIRINYLENVLQRTPKYKFGKHHGADVIRYYCVDEHKQYEYLLSSPKGNAAQDALVIREKAEELLKKYKSRWQSRYKDSHILNIIFTEDNKIVKLQSSNWDAIKKSAKSESEKKDEEYSYFHNNIKMRSRFEILTAEVLDSMDLEYVYEAKILADGKIMYPDFIVKVPELGCCFIIECLGMMENKNYYASNINKINSYLGVGFILGRDILFIMGGEKMIPDSNQIRAQINGVLDNLCYTLVK